MALFSMTGFGEARGSLGNVQIEVEARSVNHRFLDVNCKLPPPYLRFEGEIGRAVRAVLKRGRVDVLVTRTELNVQPVEPQFREDVFRAYIDISKRALKIAGVAEKSALADCIPAILFRREVLEVQSGESAGEDELPLLIQLVDTAVKALAEMRRTEGAALEQELLSQLAQLDRSAASIRALAEKAPVQFQERLKTRLERVAPGLEIDPARLAQEVALMADRIDVTEELVRLSSHLEQFRKVMSGGDGGRKLEFLLQEVGREINTTGSKAQSSDITSLVVDSKAIVEKIREQVLNLE
ncbi:MAG: YicC/YloC family endoribonuclease [Bdellovibrionota bacterium]